MQSESDEPTRAAGVPSVAVPLDKFCADKQDGTPCPDGGVCVDGECIHLTPLQLADLIKKLKDLSDAYQLLSKAK